MRSRKEEEEEGGRLTRRGMREELENDG